MARSDDDAGSPNRKRRRTIAEEDDEDGADNDNEATNDPTGNGNDEDGDSVSSQPASSLRRSNSSRASLLERRSAERRRQRRQAEIQREAAELQAEDFHPVDDDYLATSDNDEGNGDIDDAVDHDADDEYLEAAAEEEEDGEDLIENAERDYQPIAALDSYGREGIDDRDFDMMDEETRRAAEAELAVRDRQSGVGGRSAGLYGMALDVMEAEEDEDARRARRSAFRGEDDREDGAPEDEDDETDEEDLDGDDQINIEAFDVPLREWIAQDRTRREIQRKFRAFLRHFTEEDMNNCDQRRRRGNGIYEQRIRAMCAANLSTLHVSYVHLMEVEPVLAVWLADAPRDMLEVLKEAATRHTLMLFPAYNAIKSEIHVRISHLPILDSLRDLRRSHLACLVKVCGVVTRRNASVPRLQVAVYQCLSCQATQGPFRMEESGPFTPDECPSCEGTKIRLHPTMSVYGNVQTLNLQETPGSVPPGRVPRSKEVCLMHDLIDVARPGEEIEVTGIYERKYDSGLTLKSGFPVFSTYLTANHIHKREDASSASNLSESDIRQILELAKDPRIGERIVQSIAPSIFGHEHCKMALAMSLFGGVPKNVNDKHRIRGDVNVLLLGDPGYVGFCVESHWERAKKDTRHSHNRIPALLLLFPCCVTG
jgi:DNA replication licensing factor MCM2